MNDRSERETLPDGTQVFRRYLGNALHSELRISTLPSGKRIDRTFDGDGHLIKESHGYGILEIQIERGFEAGAATSETYFVRRRVASRTSYEKARLKYGDMPPADNSLVDSNAELLKDIARERREEARAARRHQADSARAAKLEAFCRELMGAGRTEDASVWIKKPKNTLGELNRRGSVRLLDRLLELGCPRIFACEIDAYADGRANTGHLVAELPTDTATREKLFKKLRHLAAEQGFSCDPDDGQRLAYIKLD